MDLNEFAQQIHSNAVSHGFWPEGRTDAEVLSLVHSEWSEALESYRNDEPMYFHVCNDNMEPCTDSHCEHWDDGRCLKDCMDDKPEGASAELVDGCIRILDAAAAWGLKLDDSPAALLPSLDGFLDEEDIQSRSLPWLVSYLHYETSIVFSRYLYMQDMQTYKEKAREHFSRILATVREWLEGNDIDYMALMQEKHHYNLTRPYKHGKRI